MKKQLLILAAPRPDYGRSRSSPELESVCRPFDVALGQGSSSHQRAPGISASANGAQSLAEPQWPLGSQTRRRHRHEDPRAVSGRVGAVGSYEALGPAVSQCHNDVHVIDLRTPMLADGKAAYKGTDGVHPNCVGHEIMARTFLEQCSSIYAAVTAGGE